jgi:uncharacterized protein (DUF427 family)
MTHQMKLPGPEHPIAIEPSTDRVTVRSAGRTIGESTASLVMHEADYPPVHYLPIADVDQALLAPSDTTTYCPYKGDAAYLSITVDPEQGGDAVWFYDEPYPAVEAIRGHVAFYAGRVEIATKPD